MSSYKELKREFDEKVEQLQKSCPHEETLWMEYHWAIGHWDGTMIEVCLRCDKVLRRKRGMPE